MVNLMEIDELGDFRFKGKKETDHNTIFIDITLRGVHLDTKKKTFRSTASLLAEQAVQNSCVMTWHCQSGWC